MSAPRVTATAIDAGCWVDGGRGRYARARVIEIALDCGWEDSEATEIVARYPELSEDQQDALGDVVNNAEQYLNEHVAPEGFSFGWHDGEFFLWSDTDWQEVGA
jgi:hypothetical protein